MATTTSQGDRGAAKNESRTSPGIARWLALGAVAGPILLTLAWIILGLMRPDTKNEWGVSGGIAGMITQPFSGLGLGPNGALFNTAFLLSGLLIMANDTIRMERNKIRPAKGAVVSECNMAGSIYFFRFQNIGRKTCDWICAKAQFAKYAGFVSRIIDATQKFARRRSEERRVG